VQFQRHLCASFRDFTQLNTFVSNFLDKFLVLLNQQIVEGFLSFTGILICACSDLIVHFRISLSLVWSTLMFICLLYACISFLVCITEFFINK
jgi:hypothetical protein